MLPPVGVCSWSLQATSVPELVKLLREVGAAATQVALGDPVHGSWKEGDDLVKALLDSQLEMTAAMISFPGEDYTSLATIRRTGGFGDAQRRDERLEIFKRAVDQTRELGLEIISCHVGHIPAADDADRGGFLDCLADAVEYVEQQEVILAMETGQESTDLVRRTLDEMASENLGVNFDPANMILYDSGDPLAALKVLGGDICHVHVKDARRATAEGEWGIEVPLGEGEVGIAAFLEGLSSVDYVGPLLVEREVGDQRQRVEDVRNGVQLIRRLLTEG